MEDRQLSTQCRSDPPVKIFRPFLMVLLVALLGTAGSLLYWVNSGATLLSIAKTSAAGHDWTPDKPLFVLLVGDDLRPDAGCGCADAVHVVGIPAGGGQATMVDIPRDTRVMIPGYHPGRINEAWARGGNALSAKVVGDLVGVHISYVVHVNYVQFPKIVDELGGVDVDVPFAMNDTFSGANFKKGRRHMNGKEALAFSRNRHIPAGDFTRSEDQGRFILATLATLQTRGNSPGDTLKYLATLMRHTDTTNVGTAELYRLSRLAITMDPAKVRNVVMPGITQTIGGASYVITSKDAPAFFKDFADDAILQNH